jgi:hypothetical protein
MNYCFTFVDHQVAAMLSPLHNKLSIAVVLETIVSPLFATQVAAMLSPLHNKLSMACSTSGAMTA